jgi:hypothetical protein
MKHFTSAVSVLAIALATGGSWAQGLDSWLNLSTGGGPSFEEETPVPLAPRLNMRILRDFCSRVEAAIETGDLAQIGALYQTNGIAVEELRLELARWRPVLGQQDKVKVSLYLKDLNTLSLTANQMWGESARSLTTHKATHLAFLQCGGAVRFMLPLVLVEGRLLVVPSDKLKSREAIEPRGPVDGSQPFRSPRRR